MEESRLARWLGVIIPVAVVVVFAVYSINSVRHRAIQAIDSAAAVIEELAPPPPTPTPNPEPTHIRLLLNASRNCTADDQGPHVHLGGEVCFTNDVGHDITLGFLNPQVIQGNLREKPVARGSTECIHIVQQTTQTPPITLEYIIFDEDHNECSEEGNRPKIIIDR